MDEFVIVSPKENCENHVIFNVREYITDIARSYKNNWNDIWYQLLIDLPRSNVRVDGIPIKDPCELYTKIGKNKTIICLCTQAALFFPYMIISQTYSSGKDVHVLDGAEDSVDINGPIICIRRTFKVKDCEIDYTLCNINMTMTFDLLMGKYAVLDFHMVKR